MKLVDSKCLTALQKVGLDVCAERLAKECQHFGAANISFTLNFLKDEEEADAKYIAKLVVVVEKV